ncbi:MAG: hypothetical protein QM811_23410 [Pirellulales bacterium]
MIRKVSLTLAVCCAFLCGSATFAAAKEALTFRCVQAKHMHDLDKKTAESYRDGLKKLGVDAKIEDHGNHVDLQFTCPDWREASFDTHERAHQWEAFLKKLGFEVKHDH